MKVYIGSFLAKYNLFFGITDGGDVSATFRDELDNESSKLSYILFIALIIWLPYIPIDMELHKYPPLALALRLGFSLTALVMLAIKWTKAKKIRSSLIIIVTMSYLFLATALVTSTSGDMFQAYMGGFMLVIMIPVFAPVSLLFKILIPAASFALFFAVGITEGIDYSEPGIRYAMNDMTVSLFLSVLFSISQNNLRHSAWKQRQKLREMVESNDKNLATIFDLAKKAEASDRAKSEFLAMMSHEIRTPMNAIIGIAQIQLHNKNLQPEYASALEKIYNSGNSLLGIINDILDLSKIETGKLQLCPIEYSVPRMINDSVQINVVRIGQKPVEFVLEIDEDLPKRLIGDELRIKQILNNILSNAIKYTERGRVILTVKSQRKGDSVALRFTVEDTGQGIKDEDKGRLFLEYQRFNDEANRATEGTGLGLNITKRLVELMDGTVEMESKYGVGTVFTITVMQESAEIDTVGAEMARELNSFTYRGERALQKHDVPIESMPYGSVLVVDDVETNLYVAKGLLSPYKVFVDTAGSGFEAIEKTDGGRTYDIIFMDHMMPQMDGIEATQKLRQKGYKGAIVALTANALAGNDELYARNGFDGFISKPIDIEQLNEVMNANIRDRSGERASRPQGPDGGGFFDEEGIFDDASAAKNNVPDPELLKNFCREANKAVKTFRDISGTGNIAKLAAISHAMNAALSSIGEPGAAEFAKNLELAGLRGDLDYIDANAENFIVLLENLVLDYGENDAPIWSINEPTQKNGAGE